MCWRVLKRKDNKPLKHLNISSEPNLYFLIRVMLQIHCTLLQYLYITYSISRTYVSINLLMYVYDDKGIDTTYILSGGAAAGGMRVKQLMTIGC